MRHPLFISKTVLVKNQNVEEAVRLLNRLMAREGLMEEIKRLERYEKPWQTRKRINYERCRSIYAEDMSRKLKFLLRKDRVSPFPGCY